MEESSLKERNVLLYFSFFVGALCIVIAFLSGRLWKKQDSDKDKSSGSLEESEENSREKRGSSKGKSKKKSFPDRRQRDLKAVFSHPWLLTSLKGHAGKVLDMDFSGNRKFLASCADESPKAKQPNGSIGVENSDEDSSSSQGSKTQGLSRRQRRNASKKKQDDGSNGHSSKMFRELGLDEKQIYRQLSDYVIRKEELKRFGFPVESATKPGEVVIQETNGFANDGIKILDDGLQKCCRCRNNFSAKDNGEKEPCCYHWGKFKRVYSCCNADKNSKGCTTWPYHVCLGPTSGIFVDFVKTRPNRFIRNVDDHGVYAMDCEMCFTTKGLELVRVTLIKPDGSVAYDSLVKPSNPVIDHNTKFSGITAKQLSRANKTLQDVQRDLVKLVNSETILIGHSLENDLRALHILHSTVVDTSIVFPHYYGPPYRRSLKSLMVSCLKKAIQKDAHNSIEDARSCLELMLWRLKKDMHKLKDVN